MTDVFDPTKYSGSGMDELDSGSKMPQLKIIQELSPEKNKNKDEYIDGAEVGNVFFTPTHELVEVPITVLPVRMKALYAEWSPRSVGDGLIGLHDLNITQDPSYEKGRVKKYDEWLGKNELLMTHYWFMLAKIGDEFIEVILPMSKSQLKISRGMQETIRKFRYTGEHKDVVPPLFAQTFELSTEYLENDNGDGYYNWKLTNATALDFKNDGALLNAGAAAFEAAVAALPSPEPQKQLAAADTGDDETIDADVF